MSKDFQIIDARTNKPFTIIIDCSRDHRQYLSTSVTMPIKAVSDDGEVKTGGLYVTRYSYYVHTPKFYIIDFDDVIEDDWHMDFSNGFFRINKKAIISHLTEIFTGKLWERLTK